MTQSNYIPVVCAWCQRRKVKVDGDEWVETTVLPFMRVTHGVCPPCRDKMLARLREKKEGQGQ